MNRFLQDIYHKKMLISDVLKRRKLNEAQIALVRRQPRIYLCSLLRTLFRTWNLLLTPTQMLVLVNYYSFNGEPAPTEDALSQKLDMPVDRVHTEWRKALFILRLPQNKRHIDRTILNVARKILASSGSKAGR